MAPVTSFAAGFVIAVSLSFVRSQTTTIASNTRDSTPGQSIGVVGGTTDVNSGITYWLSGSGAHNISGRVNNNGDVLISQTDACAAHTGLVSGWGNPPGTDGSLYNGPQATWTYNDIDAGGAPYLNWDFNTFENQGIINWCGRGDYPGGRFYIGCNINCENTASGIIQWEQVGGSQASTVQWRNRNLVASGTDTSTTTNVINNGAFRIINTVYTTDTNVMGNGCFQIANGSTFYLRNVNSQSLTNGNYFANMSIAFTGAEATMRFDPTIYTQGAPEFGARIYGFFGDALMEFNDIISDVRYDGNEGLLTLTMSSGQSIILNIGPGYAGDRFTRRVSTRSGKFLRAIQYVGDSFSQSLPPTCSRTAPQCQALQPICTTSSVVTATTSATSSASSSVTTSLTSSIDRKSVV